MIEGLSKDEPLVYFVSGMWCGSCAKTVEAKASAVGGVRSAHVSFPSKLLRLETTAGTDDAAVDARLREAISETGFAVRRQSAGWIRSFQADLAREQSRTLSDARVAAVWFLAMWSSMFAFATYLGDLGSREAYLLSLASAAFGAGAIAFGIPPYARSGARALLSTRRVTLDLFVALGGIAAAAYTAWNLAAGRGTSYADSGAMVVAILLLAKKLESVFARRVSEAILFEVHSGRSEVEALRDDEWERTEASTVRSGERVRVRANETVTFDGTLVSAEATLNPHLLTGENLVVRLRSGDTVLGGSVAGTDFEMTVAAPLGHRRIDRWTESALVAADRAHPVAKAIARVESGLATAALVGAIGVAAVEFAKGRGTAAAIEGFFVGILIFCPCLFASIIPLSKQLAYLAVRRSGALLNRAEALFDLARIERVCLDKTGTLEAVDSYFEGFGEGLTPRLGRILAALAARARHPILAGLVVDAESTASNEAEEAVEATEYPGEGVVAHATKDSLVIGRPGFVRARTGAELVDGLGADGYPLVAANGKLIGRIVTKEVFDENSRAFLRALIRELPEAEIEILSGDPRPGAGVSLSAVDPRIRFRGNLGPEEKAALVDARTLYVGDGLNDTVALAKAGVGCRVGRRVLGLGTADLEMRSPDLRGIVSIVRFARRYRRVLVETAALALLYNAVAISLALAGKFSPLGAAAAMLLSFAALLGSVSRLLLPERRRDGAL